MKEEDFEVLMLLNIIFSMEQDHYWQTQTFVGVLLENFVINSDYEYLY